MTKNDELQAYPMPPLEVDHDSVRLVSRLSKSRGTDVPLLSNSWYQYFPGHISCCHNFPGECQHGWCCWCAQKRLARVLLCPACKSCLYEEWPPCHTNLLWCGAWKPSMCRISWNLIDLWIFLSLNTFQVSVSRHFSDIAGILPRLCKTVLKILNSSSSANTLFHESRASLKSCGYGRFARLEYTTRVHDSSVKKPLCSGCSWITTLVV